MIPTTITDLTGRELFKLDLEQPLHAQLRALRLKGQHAIAGGFMALMPRGAERPLILKVPGESPDADTMLRLGARGPASPSLYDGPHLLATFQGASLADSLRRFREVALVSLVNQVLTDDLLKPNMRKAKARVMAAPRSFGHCYAASEALYRLLGGKAQGYKPVSAKDEDGITHWWVAHSSGRIIDPTATQYINRGITPPYARGRGRGFIQPSGKPRGSCSTRADAILSRVRAVGARALDESAPDWRTLPLPDIAHDARLP